MQFRNLKVRHGLEMCMISKREYVYHLDDVYDLSEIQTQEKDEKIKSSRKYWRMSLFINGS